MFADTGTMAYFRFGIIHYHFYYGPAEEVLWIYPLVFNPSVWLQSLAGCGRDDDILTLFWPFFPSISTVVTALVSSWLMVPRVLATEKWFFPVGSCYHRCFFQEWTRIHPEWSLRGGSPTKQYCTNKHDFSWQSSKKRSSAVIFSPRKLASLELMFQEEQNFQFWMGDPACSQHITALRNSENI